MQCRKYLTNLRILKKKFLNVLEVDTSISARKSSATLILLIDDTSLLPSKVHALLAVIYNFMMTTETQVQRRCQFHEVSSLYVTFIGRRKSTGNYRDT